MNRQDHGFLLTAPGLRRLSARTQTLSVLVVAVPQEDGIIHGHGQLQHRREGFGNIGDLSQEEIAAKVQYDHDADGGEEDEGNQPAVQKQQHSCQGAGHCQSHIDGLFLLAEILQVRYQSGQSGDKALRAGNGADLADRFHGDVRRRAAVKEDGHSSRMVCIENLINPIRQHFLGNRQIGQ